LPSVPNSIPVGNLVAQTDSRNILAAWAQVDAVGADALVPDYGSIAELSAITWTARDQQEAASFVRWYDRWASARLDAQNKQWMALHPGQPAPVGMPTPLQVMVKDGQWNEQLYDALQDYARSKLKSLGVPIDNVPVPKLSEAPPALPPSLPVPNAGPVKVPQSIPGIPPPVIPATLPPVLEPPAVPVSPAVQAETHPQLDQWGTIALAQKMINAESAAGWKTALKAEIGAWQKKLGLKVDSLFGTKSALKMAEEVGILPLVRYYSATGGSQLQQVAAYRVALNKLADQFQVSADGVAHAKGLRSSAAYEAGQGYAGTPKAIPVSARQAQAAALAAQL
jgi:hypothetical protein